MLPFDKKPAVTIILGKMKDKMKPEAKPEMESESDNPLEGLDSASEAIMKALQDKDPKMLTDALLSFIDQASMLVGDEEQESED